METIQCQDCKLEYKSKKDEAKKCPSCSSTYWMLSKSEEMKPNPPGNLESSIQKPTEISLVKSKYQCPKCGGTDSFMSKRTVMTGIGGIWGNRGGVREFPVCRVCDEIMDKVKETQPKWWRREKTWFGLSFLIFIIWIIENLN